MKQQEQFGDYVIELLDSADMHCLWHVRMAGSEEILSEHFRKIEAIAAMRRYMAGDKRRKS